VAPAGTPKTVISRINTEFNRVLKIPAIREKLAAQGIDAAGGTPEELGRACAPTSPPIPAWSKPLIFDPTERGFSGATVSTFHSEVVMQLKERLLSSPAVRRTGRGHGAHAGRQRRNAVIADVQADKGLALAAELGKQARFIKTDVTPRPTASRRLTWR